MRTHSLRNRKLATPELTVLSSTIPQPSEIVRLVDTAWSFAHTSLWNSSRFSLNETEASKNQILEYLTLAKNPRKAFSNFCQRVLLARQYVNAAKDRVVPLPSVWLNREYQFGFAGTKPWFLEIKQIRESLPNYKGEIKAFAEAVLEFSEEPTKTNYEYWRGYFIEKKCPGLLNLFQATAIQQLYNQN